MRSSLLALAATGLIFSALSCSDSKDDKTAENVQYGLLKTSLLDAEATTNYNLTSAACSSNADSGLFSGSFGGDGGARLEIKIKGFSTAGGTYTCTQATDNVDGDVGQKYNACSVEIVVPNVMSKFDTYDMHRTADTLDAFTYDKSCTIVTTYVPPKVTMTVNCAGLVQTFRNGAVRNPIESTVTATVNPATTAACNI